MKKIIVVLLMIMMAEGFNWSLPQETNGVVQITLKNQFSFEVHFNVNGFFVCWAKPNSSCTARVKIGEGPYKLDAWSRVNIVASKTLDTLVPGKNIIWATGNVELNPIPFPTSSQAVANQTAPKGAAISFMTSVATLNYQGQEVQNRAQTASLTKIKRQISSSGATYTLSGQGGIRIGKDGKDFFCGMSPITVKRNFTDRLSSDKKGLGLWLNVINGTLNGLVHKHMASGAWEEPITLSLGDAFPETIQVRFRARPLPEPDNKWTLITADSGLISFRALDEKYQDSLVYGRYRGVLVYSPKADAFLQAAAAFNLYHGDDQFRIEQLHFAADASGKQLEPVLNVGPYLDFKQEAPAIATQGAFPTWCVQATQVLDVLHLAVMTAAEGSTNPVTTAMTGQSLLNWQTYSDMAMSEMAGHSLLEQNEILNKYLDAWQKALNFINTQRKEGTAKAMYELAKDLGKDIILDALDVLPFGIGNIYKIIELSFTVQQAAFDQMDYDLNRLMRAPFYQKKLETTLKQGESDSPIVIDKMKRSVPTFKKKSFFGIFLAVGLAVGGGLLLAKLLTKNLTPGNGGNKYDGTYNYSLTNVHGINTKCYSCVTISKGEIKNNEGSFKNAHFASNGDLSFSGPCPNGNNAQGNYVGQLIQSNPSYKWSGHWTCADSSNGGPNSIWTIWR